MAYTDLIFIICLTILCVLIIIIYTVAEDKDKKYATEHDHYRIAYNKTTNLYYIQQLVYSNSEGAIWVTMYTTATMKRHVVEQIMDNIINRNSNAVEDDDITI